MKQAKCSLYNKIYSGYGNNASPLSNKKCCDDCNIRKVIPARLKLLKINKN